MQLVRLAGHSVCVEKIERISGMDVTRKLVTSLLLLALPFTEACTRKKPPLASHPPAPTIAETLPAEIPESAELPPEETAQAPVLPPPPSKKPAKKTAKTATKKSTPPASTTAAATPPSAPGTTQTPPPGTQTVASLRAHNGSAPDPAPDMTVAAAIPSDKANKQREDTARMVDTTESKLKGLTRQLNDEEKGMRTQIETYLQQSRKATTDGDYERAFNLAKKAEVLADALIKP